MYTHLASRAYHRSHAFSSGENARYDRRQSTSPHAKQITAELARFVIDAMAIADRHRWDCKIA
jgi:hypothetical protein